MVSPSAGDGSEYDVPAADRPKPVQPEPGQPTPAEPTPDNGDWAPDSAEPDVPLQPGVSLR